MRYLLLLLLQLPLLSTAIVDSLLYSKDYTFPDGIYLSFEDFKYQRPILKERIVSNVDKNDEQFMLKVMQKNVITYTITGDTTRSVKTNALWGYSRGGIVFVNHGKEFNRLVIIGSLCHFTAFVTTYGYQHDPYNLGTNSQPGYAQEQFMIDMLLGKIMPFSVMAMEFVLPRDEELYKEWTALSKKKKKNSTFLFLRKYNQKHPLYFPL